MKMTINDRSYDIKSLDQIQRALDDFASDKYLEIWLKGDDGSALCVLTNETKAFLMYLRYAGDCGYSSQNKKGNVKIGHEFKLSNGQTDIYTEDMTVERKLGFQELFEYFETGKRSNNIEWSYYGDQ